MAKVVPLPNNGSRHLTLGVSALQKKNYASAVAHLEKAYKETPLFEVARPLVKAYVGLKQPSLALPYVSQYMEDFLSGESTTQLLFDVLLALPDYRFAWAVLNHVDGRLRQTLTQRVADAEQQDGAAHAAAIETLAKKLRHLGGYGAHTQETMISDLGRLPKASMIAAATPNLTDPDVHPAIRVSLLDALTAVGADDKVKVLGYQTEGEIVPSALPGVMNDKTLLAVLNQVQLQIGLTDPELMRATVETLRFELGYLYPFIDQSVTDPKHFAASYLNKEGADVTAQEKAIFNWLGEQTLKLSEMAK
ncbi:hypothetical protein [Lacticaseibacillus camelliae]|uniref:TPR repeat-containing protein n=1 Tax=Lacticaseibacillus camelliae DSM 22697 = JCM 13995 TaxID=1423730 RepID=A0A0R2F5R2_9LACO|nr:hypothetical protein [Lacticaseibacillus camelliae]KRN21669.1 TPR repeat-containing protein [Lacticaseibacillus camelliae DSM 22697 = JCM 13995]